MTTFFSTTLSIGKTPNVSNIQMSCASVVVVVIVVHFLFGFMEQLARPICYNK